MGKNRKRKTAAQPPGPGPQPGMRPPPPPPHGGFRGPAPVRPMGPPGQRFPVPHHDFGPQPPRMMMMDDEPFHPMDFPDRHEFHPPFDGPDPRFRHPEFENRPPHFYHPEMDYGPRFCDRPPDFCPPEFDDRPPDFCPPEFRGRPPNFHPAEFEGGPGFHRMNPGFDPMEQYGPRDPYYMPQMDVHGNHAFGDRGVFAGPPPPDFRGPGPVQPPPEVFNAANNCGYIEREDLKKFSFVFDAFFGSRAHLVPGVKVHFTVVKNLGKECAVDVKVAPGGTEDIDSTVYEGVVLTALPFDSKDANPGCIRTIISKDPIKLPFGKTDTNVTLLLYDRVEFQLLTNVITKEQRATNIKPKTPDTFQLTKEVRVMKHDSLTGSAADSLSDEELNVMDEVELTVLTVNDTKKAIRLKKLPEGSVTFNQKGKSNENSSSAKDNTSSTTPVKDKWKPVNREAGSVSLDVSSEKYEGTITKIAPKKSPTEEKVMDNQEPALGLLVTTVEGTEKQLSFKSGDVITKATMMIGDKVQFNISINSVTSEECAVNVEILPETFQTDSEEHRKIGLVVKLDDNFGFIKTQQDPQLFFDVSEVMEDTKLTLSEKVEFTVIPSETAEGGKQAFRIRRLNESVFTSAPKLEAFGVKEKKKMTIKLLKDPKDQVKDGVKTEDKGSESVNLDKSNKGKDKASMSSSKDLKKDSTKGDRARSRSRENSRRRYSRSRSRSKESGRRRYSRSRSRSRSRDRSRSYHRRYRSSSHERRDSRHRHKRSRSRSKERGERYRRSRSRSRERSSQSARKRSRSPERYAKQSSSKDPSDKKRVKSPDNVDDELLRKRKELMELNELIARKKAIVAMEQNAKKIEPEDGKSGVTTFDYEHVHRENIWMPDLKPVKSILKKHSEPLANSQSQASASKETAASFIKSENQEMQIGYHQQTCAFGSNTPGYSTFESIAERTTAGSDKTSLAQIHDPELVRKKKQLEDLSESIARKRAIIAMEQKVKVVRDLPEMEAEYEFDPHTEDQFVMPKANLWSSEIKPEVQPKKSILKKRSDILTSQSDTTSVDEYGQPSPDGSSFAKPPSQKTAALPFNRSSNLQPIHSVTLGIFNRIMNESSAASQKTKTPPFNKPVIPQSLAQVASSRSLLEQKSPSVSKGSNSLDDQHRASSRLAQDHPPSSNPSTSQTSPSDPKRNLTTQMERFLSALNKADTSVVNSLFQEARKDLAVINTQKPPQRQLDRNIPFMDEIYDPFKEDEENDQPSFLGKQSGRERVKTETCLNDPSKDDLLPHERAIQDGSGFSRLVGMKYGVDPTAKAGHPMVSENWSAHKEDPNQFSEQWNPYEEDTELYATGHQRYTDERSLYKERSQSAEYQKVNSSAQHSYVEDREMPDSQFDKSLARQESEESSEDKDRKSENFEKIQSLLQTIGLHLDTAEVSKLADRTQERLYGKMRKPPSAPSHSFEQKRERSVSQTEQRGSSRADSSDSESLRSVSPAQSSNRKVYMSYKDSVKYKDQQKVEDVDLTSIKRTVVNLKPESDEQDPYEPEATAVSQALYQPMTAVTTVQSDSSQYAQSSTVPNYLASQYSQYQSSGQNSWGSVAPGLYPYGTVPPPPNLGYASGYQAMPPHMMSAYSSYTAPMPNPYCVPPPLSMPHPYGPPSFSAMASAYSNQAASEVSTESLKTKPVRCLKTIETVQTVPTTVPTTIQLGPARALVTIQPTEDSQANQTSEEAKNTQVATITEDDIKAKQKKRLEQFNQRMKLKKEQQMEAQRSRGQNRNSAPGKSTPNEIKNVWICGHSLVFWAEKRATSPEYGVQLGMHPDSVRIWWKGVQGMTWQQLVPVLHQLKDNWPKPDVLIIHLGGNDISTTAPEAFIETVKKDMTSLKSIFPRCLLVWSSILPRQSWRGTEDSKEMDIFRMAINERISDIMTELGGSALSHSNIRPSLGLYRPDGVHLSGKGIDTFNLNLQAFLEKWESETNKTETETSDPSA
ncbi:Cold shock domain-containing protein E1 [Labeo rohita]|uniref:Cold shock domain-containing protein E1 n=1 Tax=Labeo rohita TaxID=84645 RepID=A0ABQ8M4I8_LABRO|nr:Cold shock domain-containing protein E1 [Labeo rohita]